MIIAMSIFLTLSIFLKGHDRIAGIIFSVPVLLHEFFLIGYEPLYIISDAVISGLTIEALSHLKPSRTTVGIMAICVISIVLSYINFVVWYSYSQVETINMIHLVLYICSIAVLFNGGSNGKILRLFSRDDSFYPHFGKVRIGCSDIQKKA